MLKYLLPKSLFGRGLLIVALPIVLVQLVTAYIFFDRHWDNVTKHLTNALAGEIAFVSHLMKGKEEARRNTAMALLHSHTSMQAEYRADGRLNPATASRHYPELQAALRSRLDVPFTLRAESNQVVTRIALESGVLTLRASNKRLESPTTTIFVLVVCSASFLFLCIALLFLRNQVRPIRQLADAAERFGKGRDTLDFKPSGALEVRRAGRAFLIMRERIQRQIRTRTDMLAGISHDLRTPLTRMKLQLALLEQNPDIAGMEEDVAQMERMIGEYLDFARGSGGEEAVALSLREALEDIVADYARSGADIPLAMEEDMLLELRLGGFKRMMHNLIDNAIRYGTRCTLSAREVVGKAEITVDDDGPGIAPEKRDEVFRPFARLDAARNLNDGGVGLGLAIARDVALSHGGSIALEGSPLGGLRVVVRLPL